jgi:glyoxylase-like metal-dependent hydrolase (beta-lactamase superfamily II)
MTTTDTPQSRFYIRQLLSGRDFAVDNMMARQMVNFAYIIGDRETRECLLVDPAYDVESLVAVALEDDMRVTGVLATHFHADHIGGSLMGHSIEGVAALLETTSVPVHVNEHEVPWVLRTSGISESDLVSHSAGDKIKVGEIDITLVHTPGHTPGSQCFLAEGCLVSGDTLFLEGCGRTDLPGSNVEHMYDSLQHLAALPDSTVVLPGHQYSVPPAAEMRDVKQANYVFKPKNKESWLMMFGH